MTHCQPEHIFIFLIAMVCIVTGLYSAFSPVKEWKKEKTDEY